MSECIDMTDAAEVLRSTELLRRRYTWLADSEAERIAEEQRLTIDASWTLEWAEVAQNEGSRWVNFDEVKSKLRFGKYYYVRRARRVPDSQNYQPLGNAMLVRWTEAGWCAFARDSGDLLVWI